MLMELDARLGRRDVPGSSRELTVSKSVTRRACTQASRMDCHPDLHQSRNRRTEQEEDLERLSCRHRLHENRVQVLRRILAACQTKRWGNNQGPFESRLLLLVYGGELH